MAKLTSARKPNVNHEALLWKQGSAFVFGVDEAGRGCLAGPVCAAVTCWSPLPEGSELPVPVRDSKLMSEAEREAAFAPVRERALAHGVGFATVAEIDRWNILRANHLAVARALEAALRSLRERGLGGDFSSVAFLSDGNQPLVEKTRFFVVSSEYRAEFPLLSELCARAIREIPIVKGDREVFSIAAASILAKVSRDHRMVELCRAFPAYEFSQHKGYGTSLHLENLRRVGPCPEHRRTFAPVTELLGLFPA